jgi:N-glycosylase/DNA lyase
MTVKIRSFDFDIDQIAESGQCFRTVKFSSGDWRITAFGRSARVRRENERDHIFECSQEEYDKIWFDYFDMRRDYGKIKELIRSTGDPYLIAAVDCGYGVRILRQDLWEIVATFIISQRNNIPRIKSTVAKLCEPYGDQFPTPDILAKYSERDFQALGLGYRARYLKSVSTAAANGDLNLAELKTMNYPDAIDFLKRFDGIGDKVANCVALFGLHKIEAFPVDVWIKRVIDAQYGGVFDAARFEGYAGIVQQYMFFYQRFLSRRGV